MLAPERGFRLLLPPLCPKLMRVPVSSPSAQNGDSLRFFGSCCYRLRRRKGSPADQRMALRTKGTFFGWSLTLSGSINRCDLGRRFVARRPRLHLQGAARNQRKLGVADADGAADAFCVCTVANGSGIGLDDSAAALPCPGFKKSSDAAAEDDRRGESASETTHDPWECRDAA